MTEGVVPVPAEATADPESNGHDRTFKYGKRVFKIPYVDMAPKLTREEEESLEKSLAEAGMVQPVVVTEDDTVIAGHNRLFKAAKLGIPIKDVPIQVRKGKFTDEELQDQVIISNFVGRKITTERRAHMAHWLQKHKQFSARRIAKLLGCYHTTILEDLQKPDPLAPPDEQQEAEAAVPEGPKMVRGRDNKLHPARKAPKKRAAAATLPFDKAGKDGEVPPQLTGAQLNRLRTNQKAAIDAIRLLMRLLDKVGLGERHKPALEAILGEVRLVV